MQKYLVLKNNIIIIWFSNLIEEKIRVCVLIDQETEKML